MLCYKLYSLEKQVFFRFCFYLNVSQLFFRQIATPVKIFVLFHQTGCASSSPVEREILIVVCYISTVSTKNRKKVQ